MASFASGDPVGADFREAVSDRLSSFIARRHADLIEIAPPLGRLGELATTFTGGGKRLRPAFCYWSHVAAAGQPDDPTALLDACASLDLLHVSALMHDDVMDASDTRRGVPAAHRQLQAEHEAAQGRGSAEAFGRAGAILLGDLLLVWSAELFARSGLSDEALKRAQPLLDGVRHEVTAGQFLDVLAQAQLAGEVPGADPSEVSGASDDLASAVALAQRVVEYKTSRYTVVRPCQIGAALGGGSEALVADLERFGSPLGHAFQYRDDVLGVFGDEAVTGKPAGDDLREGKRTVLVAHALSLSSPAEAARLNEMLGDASLSGTDIDWARRVIEGSGALAATERAITASFDQALTALSSASTTDDGREALTALAEASVNRHF